MKTDIGGLHLLRIREKRIIMFIGWSQYNSFLIQRDIKRLIISIGIENIIR